MSEWQPIETAPVDTAILLYQRCGPCEVGHFNTKLDAYVSGWDHRRLYHLTHWMPLPEPPK